MQPQGFLGGLSSGLVGAVLTQRKKEEDQFYELRKNRASQLSALADHVRLEDLPQLMQGIDTILQAKKPEQADAAYGSVMAKIIEERYAEEQSDMARNQAIDQTAEEEQATAGQETPIGSITDKSGVVVPSSATVVSSPNPVPVKVNPGAYAKDKIRVKTEEGEVGRKVKIYSAQQQAQLARQQSIEKTKTDERIRQFEETHADELSGRPVLTYDPERNVTTQTGRTKDGRTITQEIPGMPTGYATTQARIKSTEKVQEENRKLKREMQVKSLAMEKQKLDAKIVIDNKRIAAMRERTAAGGSGGTNKLLQAQLGQLDKKWDNEKDILMKEMAQHLKNAERPQDTFEEDEDYEKATAESMKKYQETKHKYDLGAQSYEELRQAIIDGNSQGRSNSAGGSGGAKTSGKVSVKGASKSSPMTVKDAVDKYFKK